jgi:predicted DNA-binding antitoxin AbrB/MazE fold protein
MEALKARVENGRLKLDEPTNLPEGAEVELVAVEGSELHDRERVELHASLDRALDDEEAGRFVDADDFLAEVNAGT